jgi:hypothetical protein
MTGGNEERFGRQIEAIQNLLNSPIGIRRTVLEAEPLSDGKITISLLYFRSKISLRYPDGSSWIESPFANKGLI